MVLIDTSVWIEFFRKRPAIDCSKIELLIEERRVATCLPIKAELLSGEMSAATRSVVSQAMDGVISVDPDWNSPAIWNAIADIANTARQLKKPIPGIVDRMILFATKESKTVLWTLDHKLLKLAHQFKIAYED